MSEESVKTSSTKGNDFAPKLIFSYKKIRVKFEGNCLI